MCDTEFEVFSDFIPPAERGSQKGICAMCGREREDLLKANFRKSFTATRYLHASSFLCPGCYNLYNTPKYRYMNFIADRAGLRKLERSEVIPSLIEQKSFPFVIYTTDTYKKQGWIRLSHALNYSLSMIQIGWDMRMFHSGMKEIIQFQKIGNYLRSFGYPFGCLRNGELLSNLILKIPANLQRKMIRYLQLKAGNPSWEWNMAFLIEMDVSEHEVEKIL